MEANKWQAETYQDNIHSNHVAESLVLDVTETVVGCLLAAVRQRDGQSVQGYFHQAHAECQGLESVITIIILAVRQPLFNINVPLRPPVALVRSGLSMP